MCVCLYVCMYVRMYVCIVLIDAYRCMYAMPDFLLLCVFWWTECASVAGKKKNVIMSSIATSLLWEEFFRDPSGFWDNRHAKVFQSKTLVVFFGLLSPRTWSFLNPSVQFSFLQLSPNSPDFRHKQTRKLLWIHGSYNPPWVLLQLKQMKSSSPCGGKVIKTFDGLVDTMCIKGKTKKQICENSTQVTVIMKLRISRHQSSGIGLIL
jgi:hypothetical protein